MPAYPSIKTRSQPKRNQDAPKKKPLLPSVPIGTPWEMVTAPSLDVPESVTAVGDKTGKPYFRMGDNPNGQEVVQVTPPPGDVKLGREAKIPSFAFGGTIAVGAKTPYQRQQMGHNRWQRGELARIFAARKNVPNLQAVAQANTVRDSEAYKYGMSGVARPARINLPAGYTGKLSPTVEANFRSEADFLEEQYGEQNALRGLDLSYMGMQEANKSTKGAFSSGSGASIQTVNRSIDPASQRVLDIARQREQMNAPATAAIGGYGEAARLATLPQATIPAGHVEYTDPFTGQTSAVLPAEAAILKAGANLQLEKQIGERYPELAKPPEAPPGMVYYDNPFTAGDERELLTPADAAIRKAYDDHALRQQFPKTPKELTPKELTLAELTSAVVNGLMSADAFVQQLMERGYSQANATLLLDLGRKKAEGQGSDIAE